MGKTFIDIVAEDIRKEREKAKSHAQALVSILPDEVLDELILATLNRDAEYTRDEVLLDCLFEVIAWYSVPEREEEA